MSLNITAQVPMSHETHIVFYCDLSKATCSLPLQDVQVLE